MCRVQTAGIWLHPLWNENVDMFWLTNNTGNHLWFSRCFHHSCVTAVQSTPLGLSIVIISTVGMRKARAGARWHRQEAAEAAFHPSPPDTSRCWGPGSLLSISALIPLNRQQVNQCRCNWVNCLRITWGLPRWFDHNMKKPEATWSRPYRKLHIVVHLCRFSLAQPPGILQQWVWQVQLCQGHLLRHLEIQ